MEKCHNPAQVILREYLDRMERGENLSDDDKNYVFKLLGMARDTEVQNEVIKDYLRNFRP
ncbi:MAG: hypothetical protein ABH832_02365 [bacterium]